MSEVEELRQHNAVLWGLYDEEVGFHLEACGRVRALDRHNKVLQDLVWSMAAKLSRYEAVCTAIKQQIGEIL